MKLLIENEDDYATVLHIKDCIPQNERSEYLGFDLLLYEAELLYLQSRNDLTENVPKL